MKKIRFTAIILSALMVIPLLASCSTTGPGAETTKQPAATAAATEADTTEQQASTETTAAPEKEVIIGYDAFSDTVSFSKKITDNLMANAEKAGYKVIKADSNGDPTTALQNVDAFIAQGATIIIECSWVVPAVEAVAKKCAENNIPCISIDIPVEAAYFMGTNNLNAGKVAGDAGAAYVKENWGGQLDYLFLCYTENAGEAVKDRMYGIVDALKAAGIDLPEDKIIWVDPNSSEGTLVAKQLATDFLTAHPEAKHILMGAINDQSALGMLSAIETSNRSADCVLVSHGADEPAIVNLQKEETNSWIGSVGYFPETYGDVLIKLVQDLNAGIEIPKESYNVNVFINKENINTYYPN